MVLFFLFFCDFVVSVDMENPENPEKPYNLANIRIVEMPNKRGLCETIALAKLLAIKEFNVEFGTIAHLGDIASCKEI